jgi:hypothetical protein
MERENWRNWRWERESCDELEITGVENSDELPAEKPRRPEGLRSADPKLLRLGGPGSMQSNESWTAACAAVTAVDGVAGLGLNIAPLFSVSGIPRERNAGFDLI